MYSTCLPGLGVPRRVHHGYGAGKAGGRAMIMGWKGVSLSFPHGWQQCHPHALSKSSTTQGLINGADPTTKWSLRKPKSDEETASLESSGQTDLQKLVNQVKSMLNSMNDGEISVSVYDTAWVAMIKKLDGQEGPLFPSSIEWIVANQSPDGSWGESDIFSAHDRMINTLAGVIVLTYWKVYPERCKRGLSFIRENMWRMEEEEAELMPIGFEIAFPSLIQMAKDLGLDIPFDHPVLQDIHSKRNIKLKRIPRDVLHRVPTSLLHTLEGLPDLDWDRLLALQCSDGSFLFSPSATAHAFMQTGDGKCLDYLKRIVKRFHGGVPNVYPVDMFEHLWAVDRLERLGISRYFNHEISTFLDYVHRYWTDEGICWARNTRVQDVDDTAMGFRLLRLHGYNVSPDVFRKFEKDGEFVCFAGQSTQALTGIYNLNRASQVSFPGENILQRAKTFSYGFLREKQASNELHDKWIITKDLAGEVEYALDFPWYASLPRVETRLYLEQYGGSGDIWIGKTLYRMPLVNNNVYLELAKTDFNRCQALHQLEWNSLQRWFEESRLERYGVRRKDILRAYFLAVTSIFEPERAAERLAWARTAILAGAISTYFSGARKQFILQLVEEHSFVESCNGPTRSWRKQNNNNNNNNNETEESLVGLLRRLVEILAMDSVLPARIKGRSDSVRHHLRQAWRDWLLTWRKEGGDEDGGPTLGSYRDETGLLLVRTIEICAGRFDSAELNLTNQNHTRLSQLTSSICHQLSHRILLSQCATATKQEMISKMDKQIDEEMQEMAQCVLQRSSNDQDNKNTKQTFLSVVKSFYYLAHCPSATIDRHISKVLFERVV